MPAISGTSRRKDVSYYRQVGTSPLERWYVCGASSATTPGTTAAPAIDTLFAFPFISARGGTLDRIAFETTIAGGAGSRARVGLYTSTSNTNLYPDALVVDGDNELTDGAAGVFSSTISTVLEPDALYWATYLCGVAAPTVRTLGTAEMVPILGVDNTLQNAGSNLNVARAYGALPATFPAGAVVGTGAFTVVAVRYSA